MDPSSATLPFRDREGGVVGHIVIYACQANSLYQLEQEIADEQGEFPTQLVESRIYEYSLIDISSGLQLRESSVIQQSRITATTGRIEPGLQTGALPITLETTDGEAVGQAVLEVRSDKLNYQRDYRMMLASIADHCIDLLLDAQSPAQLMLAPSDSDDTPSLHQRVAFLRHLVSSSSFHEAINRITARPHQRMVSEPTEVPTHRGVQRGRSLATAMSRGSRRMPVPSSHPVHQLLQNQHDSDPTLPQSIRGYRRFDTYDTPENRFVIFVLSEFQQTLASVLEILKPRNDIESKRLIAELRPLVQSLDQHLSTPFALSVGRPTMIPLGSTVMQRRSGYRQVLSTWLQFHLAGTLTWTGGEDVYSAGKKDIATLYEYWCYFLLLDALSSVVTFPIPPIQTLTDQSNEGLHLRLKAGKALNLIGHHQGSDTQWFVRYSYNRTYSGVSPSPQGSYPHPGSWTRSMRPDFSISLWPEELSEYEAELSERIVHIHFDAKYRIDSYLGLFGTNDDVGVSDIDESPVRGSAKRSDLLKMHAYRDAIRRSAGAYVIYPGPDSGDIGWIEYHEILPGLGAFAARPNNETGASSTLTHFIREVIEHVDATPSRLGEHTTDIVSPARSHTVRQLTRD